MPIKVLVVDDSVVIRRILTSILEDDPDIAVVGTASDGRIALDRVEQLQPDIVTLDIEMPELDGLGALAVLRKTHPRLPVIMFSTLTARGAGATLDALSLGASDYVTKPANVGRAADSIEMVKSELVPKIKALAAPASTRARQRNDRTRPGASGSTTPHAHDLWPTRALGSGPINAVLIGASTGGPTALETAIGAIEPALPVPVFVVQHMPPVFTALLADRLDKKTASTVVEVTDDMLARPGYVYVAEGGRHMVLRRNGSDVFACPSDAPPANFCRPAVDVLFKSAIDVYEHRQLGVVLTGMGRDGFEGSKELVDAGAEVFTEHPSTCVVWGMPRDITEEGLASRVLPITEIGQAIQSRVGARTPVMGRD